MQFLNSEVGQLKYSVRVAPKSTEVVSKGGINGAVSVEHVCQKVRIRIHVLNFEGGQPGYSIRVAPM